MLLHSFSSSGSLLHTMHRVDLGEYDDCEVHKLLSPLLWSVLQMRMRTMGRIGW